MVDIPGRGGRTRTAALLIALVFPMAASAQTASVTDRTVTGFLSLGAGLARPSSSGFTTVAESSDGDWPVHTFPPLFKQAVRIEHSLASNWALDVGGGVLLRRGIGVAVAVSRYADAQRAPVTVSLDEGDPVLVARGRLDRPDRTEFGVHVQMVYAVPTAGRFRLLLFGGPSRFSVKQDVLADVDSYVDYDLSTEAEVFVASGFEAERTTVTGWGGNVGADAAYFVSDFIGVGALVRYSRATVSVPNLMLATIRGRPVTQDVDAGGLHVSGGLRVRF